MGAAGRATLSLLATVAWAVIKNRSSKGVAHMATKKGKGTKKGAKNGSKKSAGRRPGGGGKLSAKKPGSKGGGRPKGGGTPKGWPWEEEPLEPPPLMPPGDGGLGGY